MSNPLPSQETWQLCKMLQGCQRNLWRQQPLHCSSLWSGLSGHHQTLQHGRKGTARYHSIGLLVWSSGCCFTTAYELVFFGISYVHFRASLSPKCYSEMVHRHFSPSSAHFWSEAFSADLHYDVMIYFCQSRGHCDLAITFQNTLCQPSVTRAHHTSNRCALWSNENTRVWG